MFSVLWSNLIDYLFLCVYFICIYWLIQKSACLGLHTIYFHSIWKTSPFSLETHSSPAPMVTSWGSPRPFLDGARAPRRFVAGVCVCVFLFRRTNYFQLSSRTQRFFLPFSVSPEAETFTAYLWIVSRTLFVCEFLFWGIYRVPQRAKLGRNVTLSSSRANTGFAKNSPLTKVAQTEK